MGLISYREWLDKEQPNYHPIGTELSNADEKFGLTGVKSKYVMVGNKNGQVSFSPEESRNGWIIITLLLYVENE